MADDQNRYDDGGRNEGGPRRPGGGGSGGGGRKGKFARFGQSRRVVEPEEPLDYKNIAFLARYIGPTGKILGRRRSSFSGQDQRKLATAIKNARLLGLLPYIGRS